MLLQALNRYYGILTDSPSSGIAPLGYCIANVSFCLRLSLQGDLLDIIPLYEKLQVGKTTKEVPQRRIIPDQVKRSSGISANFLCDNCAYVLGIADRDETDPNYARERFVKFRELNCQILAKATCPEAKAVILFLEKHNPQQSPGNPAIALHRDELLKGGNLVFQCEGKTGFVHEAPEIRRLWENYRARQTNQFIGQCLVTGEQAPIARLHGSIKGVGGANPTGASLVGFNAPAYESYNRSKGQGLNSPVSERAAFAYTTALNYLLSRENPNRKFTLGDTTVVYWAESHDPSYAELFANLLGVNSVETAEAAPGISRAQQRLREVAQKVSHGEAVDSAHLYDGLDRETPFYVLGLAPNAARLSVRFFLTDPFGKMVNKITAHYEDLRIIKEYAGQPDMIPLWQIMSELVSKKSSNKNASPLMAGSVFRSIISGEPYPAALYYATINRIRADMDDPDHSIKKINYTRAAIIKAFLIRKYRNLNQSEVKEVLCMALNEQSTNPAYLLGRLFAVLEKAQQDAAAPAKLNATIKDRYFTAACASPSSVFPVLLRLSQHHISKAENGYWSDRRIQEIMNLLQMDEHPIPAHLTLDEQGIFVLGYYHQRADFFRPKQNDSSSI
ncbi:MAG: type I-C CRISPR-associated protein Cas8c/Csd1 [Chloroflexi bacterium]|nr:type I-C CRISPR-associated protein Cas8c/Csd1 [Chloroflexota bacterium]